MNFISSAHAQTAGQEAPSEAGIMQLVLMVGLFVMFYFIAIRPQRKRQKEHTELVSNLAKGDEVVTNSGILGKITKLEDNYLVLQVADKVELKFQRAAVHAVLPKGTLKAI
ncbi:MAG: preprotein translocase subunit YajC [Pseudomonadales bacterium]